jgi:hypothetical protein
MPRTAPQRDENSIDIDHTFPAEMLFSEEVATPQGGTRRDEKSGRLPGAATERSEILWYRESAEGAGPRNLKSTRRGCHRQVSTQRR